MKVDVFLNDRYIGYVENPETFIHHIKEARRKGKLPKELNVWWRKDTNEIYLYTTEGRLRRPLIVVKDGKPLLTKEHIEKLKKGEISWDWLVENGIVEYLDAGEEENAYIALWPHEVKKDHTHLELTPLVIFGTEAALVPYIEYNKGDRGLIAAKLVRQGIGIYLLNYPLRLDTDTHILHYPQVPIVKTNFYDLINYDIHPTGQNVIVAVAAYEGYNMDDAIILNRGSIERALFRSHFFRPYEAVELRYTGGLEDRIEIPSEDTRRFRKAEDYEKLDIDGIVAPEEYVRSHQVLIGRTSPPRFLVPLEELRYGVSVRRDTSVSVRHGEEGYVDKVILTENIEGRKMVKVLVRTEEIVELGDKFGDRAGQKGVTGMILPHYDMPFTANGIVPDIIFSPHSIPTRATIGYLLELLAGKVGALAGRFVDGTPFYGETEEDLRKELKRLGFRDTGVETMYNGETGEEFKVRIFVGSKYYFKLKYLSHKKIQARARGPIQLLTRQPTGGKSKEGGLKFGEMEKDCLLGHGASLTLYERFSSDKVLVPICKKCGLVAIDDKIRKKVYCPIHGEDTEIVWVEMSYAFKLFLDELKALCIYPRLKVGPKE